MERTVLLSSRSPRWSAATVLSLGLFVTVPALGSGVEVGDATAEQNDRAERKLAEGKKLLTKGKFDEAIARFREAHDIVRTPEATLMIARARRDTGELVAAHADYVAALGEAGSADRFEDLRVTIRKEIDDLEGVLGKLVIKLVHAPKGTEVSVDGQPVDAARLSAPLLVSPGMMDVVATAPDGDVTRRQTSVNAGQTATVELAFARKGEPATFFAKEPGEQEDDEPKAAAGTGGGGSNTLAYVAGGVGVAGLAAFAILGSMANSKFDDLEKACPNGHCPPEREGDIDDGKQLQTFANIGLAVGVVGIGTGAALLVFGGSKGEEPKKPVAQIGFGWRSIQVRGSF